MSAASVAKRIIDKMLKLPDSLDPAIVLGEFAARCEMYAADFSITCAERRDLLVRAGNYRRLQIIALIDGREGRLTDRPR